MGKINTARLKKHVNLTKVYGAGKVLCPWHEDAHPSCHIYPDGVHCFSCNANADQIGFVMAYEKVKFREAVEMLKEYMQGKPIDTTKDRKPIANSKVDEMVFQLWQLDKLDYLLQRGISEKIIRDMHIGWDGRKYALPYLYKGEVRNIKYRVHPRLRKNEPKYMGMDNKPFEWLYAYDYIYRNYPDAKYIFVCEGEFDCMVLLSEGLPAVSLPNGASSNFRKFLHFWRRFKKVWLLFDMDEAGHKAADRIEKNKSVTGETAVEACEPTHVHRVTWKKEWGKDVTEARYYLLPGLRGLYE